MPDTHVHRLTNTRGLEPQGDSVLGRRVLEYNDDVEIGICLPEREADYFYRDGEGDEVIFVHEGEGVVETIFGELPYRKCDYVVIPRGTTYRFRFDTPQRWLTFYTPGEIETPNRYRNRYGQLLEHAPFSQRDFHPPARAAHAPRRAASTDLKVRVRGGYQDYVLDYHPFDVVGWDGYVYPYTFNILDFEPKAGPAAPAAAGAPDVPGPELRDLLVLPADARLGRRGDRAAVPPLQRAVRGGHVLRRRRLRRAQGRRRRLHHAAPVRAAARAAAGAGREGDRREADERAGGDVRHVPAAEADDALARARRPELRALVVRAGHDFAWRDGERLIRFGRGVAAEAVELARRARLRCC